MEEIGMDTVGKKPRENLARMQDTEDFALAPLDINLVDVDVHNAQNNYNDITFK